MIQLLSKVAIAPWGNPSLLGAGMIIYPTRNSSSLLVGALFFDRPFPEFLGLNSPLVPLGPAISTVPLAYAQPPFDHRMVSSSPYHRSSQSLSPRHPSLISPIDSTVDLSYRQEQYQQYVMAYDPVGTTSPSSAGSAAQWTDEVHHYPSGDSYTARQNPA